VTPGKQTKKQSLMAGKKLSLNNRKNLQKGLYKKKVTTGHTFIAPENLNVFSNPAVRKGKKN
jgi:hypothetical protein